MVDHLRASRRTLCNKSSFVPIHCGRKRCHKARSPTFGRTSLRIACCHPIRFCHPPCGEAGEKRVRDAAPFPGPTALAEHESHSHHSDHQKTWPTTSCFQQFPSSQP